MIRFPDYFHNGFTCGKHQKRNTLADGHCGRCRVVCSGDRRIGSGTGTVKGSHEEERNKSGKSEFNSEYGVQLHVSNLDEAM